MGTVASNARRHSVSISRLAARLATTVRSDRSAHRAGSAVRASGRPVSVLRECGDAAERLLPLGISLSDYLDVLVEPAAAASQLLAALLTEVDCQQWSFEELPPGAIALRLPSSPRPL